MQIIFACIALQASYLLFFAILNAVQRAIRRRRYNQRMEEYKQTGLDPHQVPESLRELIPLAKKWEAQDANERQQLRAKATSTDKLELSQRIVGHEDAIWLWLKSFQNQRPTHEAAAFYSMLRSFQELQLIVDDYYLPDNETTQVAFMRQTSAPERLLRAAHYKPRFLKSLPIWASAIIGFPVFILNFLIWGSLWAIMFPHDPSLTGLALTNFLSALMVGITLTLLDRWYGLYKG